MDNFTRVLLPGYTYPPWDKTKRRVPVFVKVTWHDGRLSITGVVGPTRNGNAISCGQIGVKGIELPDDGWTREMIAKLGDIWDRWHLNDMRAGCEHQRAAGWGEDMVEVVTYRLTATAQQLRHQASVEAARAAVAGEVANLDATGAALLAFDFSKKCYTAPDADGPLSGMMEVEKRETKRANWCYPHEHLLGVLMKPCPVCGHEHGSKWLREDVPEDVLEWLANLPSTPVRPAWV